MIIILLASTLSRADKLPCDSYEMPELQGICQRFSPDDIHVYDTIPDNRLTPVANSWKKTPGLYVLPPGKYLIDSPLELYEGQAILPNPLIPPPLSIILSVILLTPTDNFSINTLGEFALLKLYDRGRAGGVAGILPPELYQHKALQEAKNKGWPSSLVSLDFTSAAELSGSLLEAVGELDQLVQINGQPNSHDTAGQISLQRNIILGGRNITVAIQAHLTAAQTLVMKNSFLYIQATKGSGIRQISGRADIEHNDFFVHGYSSDESNTAGIDMHNISSLAAAGNSFGTGQGIFVELTGINDSSRGELMTNSFAPDTSAFKKGYYDDGLLEDDSSALYILTNSYASALWNQELFWIQGNFFNYTGVQGAMAVPVHQLVHLSNHTLYPDYSQLQAPVQYDNASVIVYSPGAAAKLKEPELYRIEPEGISFSEKGSYAAMVGLGLIIPGLPVNLVISYLVMHSRYRIRSRYTQMTDTASVN